MKTVSINFRISTDLKTILEEEAMQKRISLSEHVRRLVEGEQGSRKTTVLKVTI